MFRSILFFVLAVVCLSPSGLAQDKRWTLQECINYAQQNSLAIRQARNTVRITELDLQQSRMNRLPNLSASVSAGNQFGRTIDPTTNEFNNRTIGFNSYNVNLNMTLFAGNRINNAINQSKIDLKAAQLDAEFQSDNLALQIANAYLSILLSEEQLELTRQQLALSREQLDQTDKLIRAGALPENARFDFLAQIARDEQAIVEAENQVAINYLNLKQLMELDPSEELDIIRPQIVVPTDADPDQYRFSELYVSALGTQANIEAADKRLESAEIGVDLARAGFMPTLNIFGGLNTNFSTAAQRFTFMPGTNAQMVTINGEDVLLEIPTSIPMSENFPYIDQLEENFGQSFGASLQIPIYSNHRNKINIEQARLNVINQELQGLQVRQNLKTDIQRAIADARASQRSLRAAEVAVDAAQLAFDNAERQYELGAINSLDYTTARNNLDRANIELLRARYSYIFNIKRVDFYQGKPITLN